MFGDYLVSIKVRLNSDLSYYFPGLTCGLEGYTIGNPFKGDTYDAVITVYFENYGMASIVTDRLEIIDEEYLAFLEIREKQFLSQLENASHIVKKVGPKGGFKSLTFTCSLGNLTFTDREKARKIETAFKEFGKDIEEVVIK